MCFRWIYWVFHRSNTKASCTVYYIFTDHDLSEQGSTNPHNSPHRDLCIEYSRGHFEQVPGYINVCFWGVFLARTVWQYRTTMQFEEGKDESDFCNSFLRMSFVTVVQKRLGWWTKFGVCEKCVRFFLWTIPFSWINIIRFKKKNCEQNDFFKVVQFRGRRWIFFFSSKNALKFYHTHIDGW